jgi:hypothetical protein
LAREIPITQATEVCYHYAADHMVVGIANGLAIKRMAQERQAEAKVEMPKGIN